MKKKIVFIAHPIAGDVQGNAQKVLEILREVHCHNIIPIAPYLVAIQYLDDADPADRALGIAASTELFNRGYIDELWLYGERISTGMRHEVLTALSLGIPVIPKTMGTIRDFAAIMASRSCNSD